MPPDLNELNRQAVIRLSNSFHSKRKKYIGSYSLLPHVVGKPFVLAIAPFDRPHFQLQAQRAVEALLFRSYVDEETYIKIHPERDVPLVPVDLPFVVKDSGERVELGVFCDGSMPEISAVIQSTSATWSKVRAMSGDPDVIITAIYENRVEGGQMVYKGPNQYYKESLLDGLRVYHNPFAKHALNPSLFCRPEIFQATGQAPAKLVNMSESKRLLVNRTATTLRPSGIMKKILADMAPDTKFWHSV